MSIIQISKIQQRSGDLVDLPQLDQAELGFASDAGLLFIGKTTGDTENIEVLTAYSDIAFSQIDGAAASNLSINSATLGNNQVLVYDSVTNVWTNRGGSAGGAINLGNVSNVTIYGGGIDYVLTTDGTGNLSWSPKSTIVEFIKNASKATPGVITTTQENYLVNGAQVTITGVPGMTGLNGNSYYIGNLTSNSFALYSDIGLTTPVNTSGFGTFPYTTATATTQLGNVITVANGSPFSTNMPVMFSGNTGNSLLSANTTYYVLTANSTAITVSASEGGNSLTLGNASGLSLEVFATGGKIASVVGGSEGTANAGGIQGSIQFNSYGLIEGSANLLYDQSNNELIFNGTANLGNLKINSANLGSVSNLTITGGNSGQVLTTYGNGTVYWGNGGATTGGYYLHTQSSASSTWTIVHNLNTQYVSVNPVDSTGNSYVGRYDYPTVNYTNANALTLTWTSSLTGYCAVVGGGVQYANGNGPGGTNTYVQFNDIGVFGGQSNFTFNKTTGLMYVDGVQTSNITTGGSSTPGTITGNWSLSSGSRLQSTYADLGEYYAADKNYTPGTVLEFGGDQEVTLAQPETAKLAGVVSAEPAYVMNGNIDAEHPVILALIGRVKVKVVGWVSKGDMLVSAGNGYAKTSIMSPKMGTVIGKAIENKTDTGEGFVEVLVGRL